MLLMMMMMATYVYNAKECRCHDTQMTFEHGSMGRNGLTFRAEYGESFFRAFPVAKWTAAAAARRAVNLADVLMH